MPQHNPTPNRLWLKQHQINAFWHGFGISNGLFVPLDQLRLHRFAKGSPREEFVVSAEFMRQTLAQYNQYLLSYGQSWNRDSNDPLNPQNQAEFMASVERNPERRDILFMIENLQQFRIE